MYVDRTKFLQLLPLFHDVDNLLVDNRFEFSRKENRLLHSFVDPREIVGKEIVGRTTAPGRPTAQDTYEIMNYKFYSGEIPSLLASTYQSTMCLY